MVSTPNPSMWAHAVTLTATAGSVTVTGTVTFKDSLTTIGSASLVGGVATLVKTNFAPGLHSLLTASYGGSGCFNGVTSPPTSQLVYRANTALAMTVDINPSTFGQNVKLTAM